MAARLKKRTVARRDPAVTLAVQVQCAEKRLNDLSGMRQNQHSPQGAYRNDEMAELSDRVEIMRDYLSAVQATTLAGALAQLNQVFNLTARVAGFDLSESEWRSTNHAIERLLFSIESVVRSATGDDAKVIEELGQHLSPWRHHEERLRMIGLEEAA